MLQFKQNDISVELILTLTENVSLTTPYYLFVFTHVLSKDVVSFILNSTADESLYPLRYNKFTINPSVRFASARDGEWHYKVYEQASAVNTDPLASGGILEYGKLILDRSTSFTFDKYDSPTTYTSYNG